MLHQVGHKVGHKVGHHVLLAPRHKQPRQTNRPTDSQTDRQADRQSIEAQFQLKKRHKQQQSYPACAGCGRWAAHPAVGSAHLAGFVETLYSAGFRSNVSCCNIVFACFIFIISETKQY